MIGATISKVAFDLRYKKISIEYCMFRLVGVRETVVSPPTDYTHFPPRIVYTFSGTCS